MDGVFPGAEWRPVRFTGKTGAMRPDPLGWLLHVAEMDGSPWHVFDGSRWPNRKVSTGWVGRDGRVEQYLTIHDKPYAQVRGNADYWAWETEGYATQPLTADQIHSLAEIHNWHGASDSVIDTPGARGVGTHSMGGAAYGGHACPGSMRAAQRTTIVNVAQGLRMGQTMPITDADARKIADAVQLIYQVHSPHTGTLVTRDSALGAIWEAVIELQDAVKALQAQQGGNRDVRP